MKSKLFQLLAFFLLCHPASAAETITSRFEALGGKVIEESGAITELTFRDSSKLGPADWKAIGELSSLKKLTAYGKARGLNDDTVGLLMSLKKLESLSVDSAQLSDDGLAELAKITSLKSVSFFHLSFRKEGFTGKGFSAWKGMPHLKKLTVAGMSMGDEGFAAIAEIKTLTDLRTWHTYRTQASHTLLAKLPNLSSLRLGQRLPGGERSVCLNDESLATLATIKTLKSLEITEAKLSFDALTQLKSLPDLERLKIARCVIAPEVVDALRVELDGVKIVFEPLTDEQRERLEVYLK